MSTIQKVNKRPNRGVPPTEADECAPGEVPQVIAGNPADGDLVRITADSGAVIYQHYTAPAAPPAPVPRLLSKTAFQDHVVGVLAALGDGQPTTGMARFTAIMDATRDSAAGAVRFAFARYEAADVFEKTNTATLTTIMAADSQTGHITSAERTAILTNWPTA